MLKDIKGAIFDMDGTLIDSMWVWDKIDVDYLKTKGFDLPSDLRKAIEHLTMRETALYFKERFGIQDTIEEIYAKWNDMAFYEYSTTIRLKDGAKEYLNFLKNKNIKLAIATSNSRLLAEAALKNNDIYEYFDAIITGDDIMVSKASPDIYILAAEKIGLSPRECAVYEDILIAIKSAKSAGMKVVGIHDDFSQGDMENIMEVADHYINQYDEIYNVG
jgi:HAD superfamily hydrolase (TIGR01509 family)